MIKSRQKPLRSIQDILSKSPVKNHYVQLLKQNQAHSNLLTTIRELLPDSSQSHCLNVQLKYDELIVHVDSSGWATKLRFQLAALLPALRRQPGYHAATKITIRIQPPQTPRLSARLASSTMDPQTAQQIRELASAIRDETLRQTWLKLANNAQITAKTNNSDS